MTRARQAAPDTTLLPSSLDPLVRLVAPPWRSQALSSPADGTGRRVLRPLLWVLAAAVVLQTVLHLFNVVVLDLRVDRINADKDSSVVGWLGTVTTWSVAGGAAVLALLTPDGRRPLLLIAGICAFLSLDDMVVLHEIVGKFGAGLDLFPHDGYVAWPVVYLPLMGLLAWLLLRTARSVDVGNGRFIVVGLTCLVVAIGLEATAPVWFALGSDHGGLLYESEVTIEEALETTGWGTIAFGLLAMVVDVLLARGSARSAGSAA